MSLSKYNVLNSYYSPCVRVYTQSENKVSWSRHESCNDLRVVYKHLRVYLGMIYVPGDTHTYTHTYIHSTVIIVTIRSSSLLFSVLFSVYSSWSTTQFRNSSLSSSLYLTVPKNLSVLDYTLSQNYPLLTSFRKIQKFFLDLCQFFYSSPSRKSSEYPTRPQDPGHTST